MPSPSVLVLLGLIEQRPYMYLGWDASSRRNQLHALQAVLTGYSLALQQHGMGQDDLADLAGLEEFLRSRSGADSLTGIDQILATSADDEEAWRRVWRLVGEYRAEKGRSRVE